MIDLRISGENIDEFATRVRGFAALLSGISVALADGGTIQATEGIRPRSRKPSPDKPVETQPEAATGARLAEASGAATAEAPQSTAADTDAATGPSDADAVDFDKVKTRAVAFAQRAGSPALVEMLVQAGATTGKFTEIKDNGEALRKVSDALAATGF